MIIATWNVNSVRMRLGHVLDWLVERRPTVLCLQETKVEDDLFPRSEFERTGYRLAVAGQKSYNGVAILSMLPLEDVRIGLPGDPADAPRRLISARIAGLRLVNVYLPNGSEVGSEKFSYKLSFMSRLRDVAAGWIAEGPPVVLAGDFNVAPEARDVYDPVAMEGQILFHPDERAALSAIQAVGLEDVLRRHRPEPGLYTWWDYRMNAFRRKMGLRIDHIWATPDLAGRSLDCEIDPSPRKREKPSDHAPVLATFRD